MFLTTLRKKLRNEEGVEAISFIGLAILALVLIGITTQFIVPAFKEKAEQVGECINDVGQTTEC